MKYQEWGNCPRILHRNTHQNFFPYRDAQGRLHQGYEGFDAGYGSGVSSTRRQILEPGRPTRLPSDARDADAILKILSGVTAMGPRIGLTGKSRVVREALWFFWEHPRLPHPLVGSKYPATYPWSAAARMRRQENETRPQGGWGLIIEHVLPKGLIISQMLDHGDNLTQRTLLRILRDGMAGAVITVAEDKQLQNAGVGNSMPPGDDGTDPWSRYRYAGLKVSEFAPLY